MITRPSKQQSFNTISIGGSSSLEQAANVEHCSLALAKLKGKTLVLKDLAESFCSLGGGGGDVTENKME
jgi:hypothetical protein